MFNVTTHVEPNTPLAMLTEFNLKMFELEDIQRSIRDGEHKLNMLIHIAAQKYAESILRSASSSASSCVSGERNGVCLSSPASSDRGGGLGGSDYSVTSFDGDSPHGRYHDPPMIVSPLLPPAAVEPTISKVSRKRNRRKHTTRKLPLKDTIKFPVNV